MRGKESAAAALSGILGITPAYAGKSVQNFLPACKPEDHPRLCGEKVFSQDFAFATPGSPPPMRGKAASVKTMQSPPRITPAYAGKRYTPKQKKRCRQDPPRLCGEKIGGDTTDLQKAGSPPPMRGKEPERAAAYRPAGITPAYAGKSLLITDTSTSK